MSPLMIVLLVAGLLLLQVLIWIPVLLWIRKRNADATAALIAELAAAGEKIVRGPEPASYRGATDRFGRVNGTGTAVLTERRLLLRKALGSPVEVPMGEVKSVRDEKAFLGKVTAGVRVVVLVLGDGTEVGFSFRDHAGWLETVRGRVG